MANYKQRRFRKSSIKQHIFDMLHQPVQLMFIFKMANYKCFKCGKAISHKTLDKRFVCPHCGGRIFYKPRSHEKTVKAVQMAKENLEREIQEFQISEQALQNLLLQKQAFQMELTETENALKEVKNTKEDVFKIVGQIMLKADKQETEKELSHKKDILQLRLNSIEKQEKSVKDKVESLREELSKKIK